MELNNYLTLFPGSINANKMATEEFNEIILHAVPNIWYNQTYIQGGYFKGKPTRKNARFLSTWRL